MCGHPNTLEIKTIYFYIIKRIPYVSLHGSYHQKITDHLDCHLAIQLVTISFILSQENSNGIYINEIEQELVDFLQYRVHFLQGLLMQDGREIEVKVGTDIEVNIPKEEVDLVIVRNTYHHFSMKSKMMESIISSLSSDGRIIIIKPLASKDKQANCNLKMDYQDIINGLRSHDISISRESIIEGTLFLELKN